MHLADVSVIIPCFNSEKTLLRALNSVLDQTLLPREIILIDDGSTDTTLEILREFSKTHTEKLIITVNALPQNRGAAYARNTGWELATSKYIAFLDADDTWHPDKINIQHALMKQNQMIDMSGHKTIVFNKKNKKIRKINYKIISPAHILIKNYFNCPSVMLKKEIPLRFDESMRYAEDYDLWMNIVFSKYNAVYIDNELSFVHKNFYGSSGLSSNMTRMWKGEVYSFFKLKNNKKLSIFTFTIVFIFSLIKFLKRIIYILHKRI